MPRRIADPDPDAEVIALKCLGFKAQARETAFLGGVLDYLLGDEKLLVAFSEAQGLAPEAVIGARRRLPGGEAC